MSRDSHSLSADPGAGSTAAAAYRHEPVLCAEVLDGAPPRPRLIVDATIGGGGHALALLERFPDAELFGCDRDADAVAASQARLAPMAGRTLVKQARFSDLPHHLLAEAVDYLLADLGVSSHQLETGPRGFSFSQDGPLDMRMDPSAGGTTAAELVNTLRPPALVDILRRFGEERFAPRMVQAIVAARQEAPIETTRQLARIVAGVVPAKFQRRGFHPATRVFQALRIAVNDELGELERLLDGVLPILAPGGRLAIISFHSLEDRMVKDRFRAWEQPCTCPPRMPACVCGKVSVGRRVTRKPLTASAAEADRNPRSRSAKLRVFEKGGATRDGTAGGRAAQAGAAEDGA